MSTESIHADTLNALNDMQRSITYAGRRPVLTAAERIIAEQERQIKSLTAERDAAVQRAEKAEASVRSIEVTLEAYKAHHAVYHKDCNIRGPQNPPKGPHPKEFA